MYSINTLIFKKICEYLSLDEITRLSLVNKKLNHHYHRAGYGQEIQTLKTDKSVISLFCSVNKFLRHRRTLYIMLKNAIINDSRHVPFIYGRHRRLFPRYSIWNFVRPALCYDSTVLLSLILSENLTSDNIKNLVRCALQLESYNCIKLLAHKGLVLYPYVHDIISLKTFALLAIKYDLVPMLSSIRAHITVNVDILFLAVLEADAFQIFKHLCQEGLLPPHYINNMLELPNTKYPKIAQYLETKAWL